MPILPNDAVKYSQVPKEDTFTNTTIPKGLLNRHTTKSGTWGVITILKGSLVYKIAPKGNKTKKEENYENEDDHIMYPTQFILTPTTQNGIIEPERYHKVQAVAGSGDNEKDEEELEFVVEFHRVPGTGLVDEKRE
jgi:tellurite methyltransferase